MPLIDHTFFTSELNIPNTDKPEVYEELYGFIEKYEDEFLLEVLGYDKYTAFKAGLAADPVEQQWIDLISGSGRWKGLIQGATITSSLIGYKYKEPVTIKFGQTTGFPANVSSVTVPTWIGWDIIPEKIGFGTQLQGVNHTWNKDTGEWGSLNGTFQPGEYYFVQFKLGNVTAPSSVSTAKKSPIANYIYWHWMASHASETTGIGEVINNPENSVRTGPTNKMVKAWNEMADSVRSLHVYLGYNVPFVLNPSNYRGWDTMGLHPLATKMNVFGI